MNSHKGAGYCWPFLGFVEFVATAFRLEGLNGGSSTEKIAPIFGRAARLQQTIKLDYVKIFLVKPDLIVSWQRIGGWHLLIPVLEKKKSF